ncbi:MAG: hypothetical protein M3Z19_10125, partial [Chloroflexota bacterium]|nr:hypothetical protein [Chloroflexota bacterium]
RDWSQGKAIADIAAREGTHIRAYDAAGAWRGVGIGVDGAWRPKKVVTSSERAMHLTSDGESE